MSRLLIHHIVPFSRLNAIDAPREFVVADTVKVPERVWSRRVEALVTPTEPRRLELPFSDGHLVVPLAARELQELAVRLLEPNRRHAGRGLELQPCGAELLRT